MSAAHPDWLVPQWHGPSVGALMTTRHGGVSVAPFDAMNLQRGGGDSAAAVERNRALLAAAMAAAPVFLRQVHGTRVVRIAPADALPGAYVHEADASITTEPCLACVIQVADCLPVLFAAPEGRGVGAAHAGWRGLAAGVLERTVAALCEAAGCEPHELQAWLGASIGPKRFEVGADVLEAFGVDPCGRPSAPAVGERQPRGQNSEPIGGAHFALVRPDKWLADLPLLASGRLRAAGVTAISGGSWCSVSEPLRFFSFRRDRITGRMAAAVWIDGRA